MDIPGEPLAELVGEPLSVSVLDGEARYVNLDNAATTPVLVRVQNRLAEIMPWYGSVHRGDGTKSVVSTTLWESAIRRILSFSGGDPRRDTLVVRSNTTACINALVRRLALGREDIVVATEAQHSSNLLPWRKWATVIRCNALSDGGIDLGNLADIMGKHRVKLVAVCAASSITGCIHDVHEVAKLAHAHGARIFVDAAQLVAHRKIDRCSADAPEHLDFVAYAGHKMYAPHGAAVLVGPRETFEQGWPDEPGGGTVKLVNGDDVVWSDLPEREQGGTPNFPGVVALAEACVALDEIGFDAIASHEWALIRYARLKLGEIDGVTIHRHLEAPAPDSLAVFPFTVAGYHPSFVSAYLGIERGIGVRSGPICQYEFVARLLDLSTEERLRVYQELQAGDGRRLYGIVRASCGLGTTASDIDQLADALADLVGQGPRGKYEQSIDGHFHPMGFTHRLPFQMF